MTNKNDMVEWVDNNMPRRIDGDGDRWHTNEEVIDALTTFKQNIIREERERIEKFVLGLEYSDKDLDGNHSYDRMLKREGTQMVIEDILLALNKET